MILFEDRFKYSPGVYFALAIPLILLIGFGYISYVDAHKKDVIPSESAADSDYASKIFFASTLFVLAVYWLILPRKVIILVDSIKLKYGIFYFPISFANIDSAKRASGIPLFNKISSVTSYATQVEIVRKKGMSVRISPERRDLFIETLERALSDWRKINPSSTS